MNGYLKAVRRIASAGLAADAPASDAERHLTDWIRSMNQLREIDRRIEKAAPPEGNVVTLRMDRASEPHALDRADDSSRGSVDAAVSFLLNVLFDSNRSKAEIRIARAMFRPSASIVLIPRDRPALACAVGVDEFFSADKSMLKYEDSWEETWRIHDPCTDAAARTRICANVVLDPNLDRAKPRRTEVVFALRNASIAQRIHSCTIVYDETPSAISPVTMFA
jgi:hypothetical protein